MIVFAFEGLSGKTSMEEVALEDQVLIPCCEVGGGCVPGNTCIGIVAENNRTH